MTSELFPQNQTVQDNAVKSRSAQPYQPLADRMRPQSLDDYVGQDHIIGSGRSLTQAIENQSLHSMVFLAHGASLTDVKIKLFPHNNSTQLPNTTDG